MIGVGLFVDDEAPAHVDGRVTQAQEAAVAQHEVEQTHGAVVHQAVAAVREALGDRRVINRAVRAHLVVEAAALGIDVDGHHQAVGRLEPGAHDVGVHHRDRTDVAVQHLAGEEILGRRGLGRDPDRAGDDVPPQARADVGVLVLHVQAAVGLHLAAPRSDGGAPPAQRDALAVPGHEQRQVGEVLTALDDRLAAAVVGKVVPDITAVDLHRQVHLAGVVGRQRRRWIADGLRGGVVAGGVRAQEACQLSRRGHAQRRRQGVDVGADQVGDRVRLAGLVPVRRPLLQAIDRTVLDDAGGVGHALGQDALEGVQVQVAGRAQQAGRRLAAQEAPAEDVVLALPVGQRLVGGQIEHAVGEVRAAVGGARAQQPLAGQARLRRPHRAQPGDPPQEPVDAAARLRIVA